MQNKDFNVKCTGCGSVTDVPKNAAIVPGLSAVSLNNGATSEASHQDPKNSESHASAISMQRSH